MIKNRLIPAFLIFIVSHTGAWSQEDNILSIRKIYTETKKDIEDYYTLAEETTRLEFSRNIPALGPCKTTVDFYGEEKLPMEEEHMRWQIDGEIILRFVSVRYNTAAPVIHMEYLFHPENQNLIFCYIRDERDSNEQRYYFRNKILIKYVENNITENADVEKITNEKYKNYSPDEIASAKKVLANAREYITMYKQLNAFEKIEKRRNN